MFAPIYRITDKIIHMLTAIAEAKAIIARSRLLPKQEIKLRRQALIRMTHSSTAIEGNILNFREVEAVAAQKKVDAPARDIYEVENYLQAALLNNSCQGRNTPVMGRNYSTKPIYLEKEQVIILDFMESVGRATIKDIIDILHCPKRTAQLHLQKLKKLKMIKSIGKGPATSYVLS